jgi:hypothetical protein
MANTDYVPKNDNDLNAWIVNFNTVLNANLAALGLVAADITTLSSTTSAFSASIPLAVTAEAAYHQAIENKKLKRVALVAALRAMVKRVNGHPGMTDAIRAQLGITVPDRVPSRHGVGPEVPVVELELKPGQVVVHFGTTPGNELTNGKPAWAIGCNIYRKKSGDAEWTLIAFDTASPYVDTITGPAANYQYRAAYRGTRASDEGASSAESTVATGAV